MTIAEFFEKGYKYNDLNAISIPRVPLEEGAFPAFLKVDIPGNKFEIPVALIPYIQGAKVHDSTQLIFNLVHGSDNMYRRTFHKKTVNTMFTQFDIANRTGMRIAHVVSSKGVHYYGCRGMIFDADYEPLMLNTLEVNFNRSTWSVDNVSHPRCRLSYKVFENSSEIIEKAIIKQLIPFYNHHRVCGEPVEIIIGHTSAMVIKPDTPTLSMSNPTTFNTTIANYYETS